MIGKTQLLEAIAGKNRGILASSTDQQAILAAIAQLEDRNPTPRPLEVPEKLDGNWRLLFTTSAELLRIDQVPLVQLGQIYQCIRTANSRIYNIAEVSGVPWLEGLVSVSASFEPISDQRVTVKFERFVAGLQRLVGYQTPTQFIQQLDTVQRFAAIDFTIQREQRGWLDVTYLDDDLRIGRGNEGNVFVLVKVD